MVFKRWACVAGAVLLCTSVLVAGVVTDKDVQAPAKAESLTDATGPGNVSDVATTPNVTVDPTAGNTGAVVERGKLLSANDGGQVEFQPATGGDNPPVAGRAYGVDISPGADAPPDTLGGFIMTPFGDDPRPTMQDVSDVPSPCAIGGDITFSIPLNHRKIGSGWASWSHGYTGDVYYTNTATSVTITLPQPACAFYFYVEPNPFAVHYFTAVADDGTSSGSYSADGSSGAAYCGFFGDGLTSITVSTDDGITDFSIGEFGMACMCEPVYAACCIEATGDCTDNIDIMDCLDMGGRFDIDVALCADLDPPCGQQIGACCNGAEGGPGEPWECLGDWTQGECLAYGEDTNWNVGESCDDPGFLCPGTPTYCDASGGCDEYISLVQMGDIDNPSACTQYGDYTALWTIVVQALSYDLYVENGNPWSSDTCSVWVDWNQDKTFDDDGDECYGDVPGMGPYNFTIDVPPTALPGYTRMRIRIDYANPDPDPCGTTSYGEAEDYSLLVSGDIPTGSCCDPYTGICNDDVLATECLAPLEFGYEMQCAELDPECGNPGACCDDDTGTCTVEFALNCMGRFIAGAACDPDPFDPPCGEWVPTGLLYAPTEADNPAFRADVAAGLSGSPVDYYDARVSTPTLEELMEYACVFTFGNYAYADNVAMGDVLADFVNIGGKVILGQWTYHSDQANWLAGEIMEPEYCPVTVSTSYASGAYNGDGFDCVHVGITAYDTTYLDVATLGSGAWSDGTMSSGSLAAAWRLDRAVYYSPGNTGLTYGTGEWGGLVANMCICTGDPMYGACCDIYTGECEDDVEVMDCTPLQFHFDQECAELDPLCGNPGCCCEYPQSGEAPQDPVFAYEVNCTGRFLPGVLGEDCVGTAFEPECGFWVPTGVLYAPANPDNPTFRADLSELLLGSDVDYFDAAAGTPTLDLLDDYACVFTWANYAYADNVAMGDALADYVDMGGKVALGQWCLPTAGNFLAGRIMSEEGYCPATASMYSSDAYAGDGFQCLTLGVDSMTSTYYDQATKLEWAFSDGTTTNGYDFVCMNAPWSVTYVGGLLPDYSTGDYVQLVANLCTCIPGDIYGACCDIYTGDCVDNVELFDCLPMQFHYDTLCDDLVPPCGVPGACCNPYTGECEDDVLQANCEFDHYAGEQCGELSPECGNPGCCCEYPESGEELQDPIFAYALNCVGRFLPGVLGEDCVAEAFVPECGLWVPTGVLYCPANPDNPTYRAALSEELMGSDVDFFDASAGTPTLDMLQEYACVQTWANYAYADNVAMGDVLADYVDMGGKVVLGQWCLPTAGNYLSGRIMTEGYNPAAGSTYATDSYAGDGFMCQTIGVDSFESVYYDQVSALAGTFSDGTTVNGNPFVLWNATMQCYYSAGNTGLDYTTGDVPTLVANLCTCMPGEMYGACCDITTGVCEDNVELMDCVPLQFTLDTLCADLVPACGNPGACCNDWVEECTDGVMEVNCEYRFDAGGTCDEMDPACGDYLACPHSITLWDDYGDGWNGGWIDVYVGGTLLLPGLTIESGAGPETTIFDAATGDEITTVYTAGGWPYENSYCIYDGQDPAEELGCDGLGGVDPTGITVMGDCGGPKFGACCDPSTWTCTDNVEDIDCQPPLQFTINTLCEDLEPPCEEPWCGDGWCNGDETCETCPEDCGECACLSQPPNQSNGIFSDVDCDFCTGDIQILAENFATPYPMPISGVRVWGGFYPDNVPTDEDCFTVIFREDDGAGMPGAAIAQWDCVTSARVDTGVDLFGVDEWEHTIDLSFTFDAGTYWVEVYNDTAGSTESWFWEAGDLDAELGILGQAFTFTLPEAPWTYDAVTDMAVELICGGEPPVCDLDGDGDADVDDFYIFVGQFGTAGPEADLDGDGMVTLLDYQIWLACYMGD